MDLPSMPVYNVTMNKISFEPDFSHLEIILNLHKKVINQFTQFVKYELQDLKYNIDNVMRNKYRRD